MPRCPGLAYLTLRCSSPSPAAFDVMTHMPSSHACPASLGIPGEVLHCPLNDPLILRPYAESLVQTKWTGAGTVPAPHRMNRGPMGAEKKGSLSGHS